MDKELQRTAWEIYFDVVMGLLRGFLFVALAMLVLITVLIIHHFIEDGRSLQEWLQLLLVLPAAFGLPPSKWVPARGPVPRYLPPSLSTGFPGLTLDPCGLDTGLRR